MSPVIQNKRKSPRRQTNDGELKKLEMNAAVMVDVDVSFLLRTHSRLWQKETSSPCSFCSLAAFDFPSIALSLHSCPVQLLLFFSALHFSFLPVFQFNHLFYNFFHILVSFVGVSSTHFIFDVFSSDYPIPFTRWFPDFTMTLKSRTEAFSSSSELLLSMI